MTAIPGWYPANDGTGQLRWWDGHRWTEHVHVALAPPPPSQIPPAPQPLPPTSTSPPRMMERHPDGRPMGGLDYHLQAVQKPAKPLPERNGQVDNSPAWLLVALPFVVLGGTVALLSGGVAVNDVAATAVGIAATIATCVWDSRMLRARGYDVSIGLALLLVPIYLIQRSKETGQTYLVPVVWLVVFVGYLVAGQAVSNHYGPFQLDMPRIEQSIKQQVDLAASTSSTVSCPSDDTYVLGATFDCTASDNTGTLTERVTVHAAAYITWEPLRGSTS